MSSLMKKISSKDLDGKSKCVKFRENQLSTKFKNKCHDDIAHPKKDDQLITFDLEERVFQTY
jgi:hypothetical protein